MFDHDDGDALPVQFLMMAIGAAVSAIVRPAITLSSRMQRGSVAMHSASSRSFLSCSALLRAGAWTGCAYAIAHEIEAVSSGRRDPARAASDRICGPVCSRRRPQYHAGIDRLGRWIRALHQNAHAAGLMGIDVGRVQVMTFALGIAILALAAALLLPGTPIQPPRACASAENSAACCLAFITSSTASWLSASLWRRLKDCCRFSISYGYVCFERRWGTISASPGCCGFSTVAAVQRSTSAATPQCRRQVLRAVSQRILTPDRDIAYPRSRSSMH